MPTTYVCMYVCMSHTYANVLPTYSPCVGWTRTNRATTPQAPTRNKNKTATAHTPRAVATADGHDGTRSGSRAGTIPTLSDTTTAAFSGVPEDARMPGAAAPAGASLPSGASLLWQFGLQAMVNTSAHDRI